ncbi:MAG: AraC family transcriptional regulator [Novosphingobium sp.]|nr:AraC family transcriptional regulator [Novosphingobium sp.]
MAEVNDGAAASFAQSTMTIVAEARGRVLNAQLVGFHIPVPTASVLHDDSAYQLNLCLTPRPLYTRASYHRLWGPHRYEALGEIFLVPPGEELHIKGGAGEQASLTCQLQADALHSILGEELEWTDRRLADALDITNARIRSLLFRLTEEVRHPGFAGAQMIEFLSGELAVELGRFCLEVVERSITGGLASWRLRLIDERLGDDPTAPGLQELAALCNVSVRQLTRGFRASRGCSIGDYIEQRRMETAKRLLMAGDSVKAIAFSMGFASPSSFTFAFRRTVGISPSHFRTRQRIPGA